MVRGEKFFDQDRLLLRAADSGDDRVGTDDGGGLDGWKDVSEARNVTAELISRGYSEADIAKLWGGNFLRVWAQVQNAAQPVATLAP